VGWCAPWTWTAALTEAKASRDYRWQVAITVGIVSTNRLPLALCVSKDTLSQITGCRRARLLALLVGSTSCSRNVPGSQS
jgi:hypothetical protein